MDVLEDKGPDRAEKEGWWGFKAKPQSDSLTGPPINGVYDERVRTVCAARALAAPALEHMRMKRGCSNKTPTQNVRSVHHS